MTASVVDTTMPGFEIPGGLQTPAVVVDLDIIERNIEAMAGALSGRGVALRPHTKTHKSVEIARRQLDAGAVGLTVGTIGEAEVMVAAGFTDLFIAYPVWAGGPSGSRLRALADAAELTIGVDSVEGARALAGAVSGVARAPQILVEVDSGEQRTGVSDPASVVSDAGVARGVGLDVRGAFTHGGHSYAGPEARLGAANDECRALAMAAEALASMGIEAETLSAGSTPTALLSASEPVTEERPGTYVFGDRQQVTLGSIEPETVGLMVATTVVSASFDGIVVVDAGAKVLARDRPSFLQGLGSVPALDGAVVERAYDYHGVVRLPPGVPTPPIGTVLGVVPNHVCPVVNLVDQMVVVRGGAALATWPVDARGCNG